jgi:hypothetical protein
MDLVKEEMVDKKTNAETWMLSKMRHEMNAWRDSICHEIDVFNKLDADFNVLMIHLMVHWVEHICQYRALQQNSAERHEQAHKTNLKDGWKASNHNHNYLAQVITFQCRLLCLGIRQRNLQALAQCQENSPTTGNVVPSGADLAAPRSTLSYAKPELRAPQNRQDRKHPNTMNTGIRALLDSGQDATHRVTIYVSTRRFMKHNSRNMMYISDEQLHAMVCCICHSHMVQVECLEGER